MAHQQAILLAERRAAAARAADEAPIMEELRGVLEAIKRADVKVGQLQ